MAWWYGKAGLFLFPLVVLSGQTTPSGLKVLSLEDCLRTAEQNNRRRPPSRFAVAMAEAQHRQALAGYWPQVTAKAGWSRMDEAANFIFPSSTMYIPPQ